MYLCIIYHKKLVFYMTNCHKKKEQADTLYFGIHWLIIS